MDVKHAFRRVRWANGLALDAKHFQALDERIEAVQRWALRPLPGNHGVIESTPELSSFDVESGAGGGVLWVQVRSLMAISPAGVPLVVGPEDGLEGQLNIADAQGGQMDAYVVPGGWREDAEEISVAGGTAGTFEYPSYQVTFLNPQSHSAELARRGLQVASFNRASSTDWSADELFLPWCQTMRATDRLREEVKRIREDVLALREICIRSLAGETRAAPAPAAPPTPPRSSYVRVPPGYDAEQSARRSRRPTQSRESSGRTSPPSWAAPVAAAASQFLARVGREDIGPMAYFSEVEALMGAMSCFLGSGATEVPPPIADLADMRRCIDTCAEQIGLVVHHLRERA